MKRLVLVAVIAGGLFYFYSKKTAAPPPAPPPPPPEPPIIETEPPQVMSDAELARIRQATKDADPQVRWAAIQLLYQLKDKRAYKILEEALAIDTEPSVRRNALEVIKEANRPESAQTLVKALMDSEMDIRLAALNALGDVGDPLTAPSVAGALHDIEPQVRTAALTALSRIQRKVADDHRISMEERRRQYEEALQKYNDELEKRRGIKKPRDLYDVFKPK